MYDIVLREYEWFGVDLFAYGMKGSLIAFLGYIAFIAVYNRPVKIRNKTLFHEPKRDMTSIILLMYVICLAANIYYLVRTSGHSLAYIFRLDCWVVEIHQTKLNQIWALSQIYHLHCPHVHCYIVNMDEASH